MQDLIGYCKARGCLLSEKCKRAKPPSEDVFFFTDEPFRIVGTKFTCEMFWGDTESGYLTQQKETDGKGGAGEAEFRGIEETEQRLREETKGSGE